MLCLLASFSPSVRGLGTEVGTGVIPGSLSEGVTVTVGSVLEDEVIAMETNVLEYELTFRIEEVSITFFFSERAEKKLFR